MGLFVKFGPSGAGLRPFKGRLRSRAGNLLLIENAYKIQLIILQIKSISLRKERDEGRVPFS